MLGLESELTEHGVLYATLPGNTDAPTIGLVAHVDTSNDVSGRTCSRRSSATRAATIRPGDSTQVLQPRIWPEPRTTSAT